LTIGLKHSSVLIAVSFAYAALVARIVAQVEANAERRRDRFRQAEGREETERHAAHHQPVLALQGVLLRIESEGDDSPAATFQVGADVVRPPAQRYKAFR